MNWELIIGIAGLVGWGIVCSFYVWRDRAMRLVMVLPLVVFMFVIASGVGKL